MAQNPYFLSVFFGHFELIMQPLELAQGISVLKPQPAIGKIGGWNIPSLTQYIPVWLYLQVHGVAEHGVDRYKVQARIDCGYIVASFPKWHTDNA